MKKNTLTKQIKMKTALVPDWEGISIEQVESFAKMIINDFPHFDYENLYLFTSEKSASEIGLKLPTLNTILEDNFDELKNDFSQVIFLYANSVEFSPSVLVENNHQLVVSLDNNSINSVWIEANFREFLFSSHPWICDLASMWLSYKPLQRAVLCLLETENENFIDNELIIDKVLSRFNSSKTLDFVIDEKFRDNFSIHFNSLRFFTHSEVKFNNYNTIVFGHGRNKPQKFDRPKWHTNEIETYLVNSPGGDIVPMKLEGEILIPNINPSNNVHKSKHFFIASACENSTQNWFLAPRGFGIQISNGVGPINSFGFRQPNDLRFLKDRKPNHKLICLFGGSSAHAMEVPYEFTINRKIEELLNVNYGDGNTQVTVLNFGLSAHMILDQISTYITFAEELSPDLVISHDGFNDLWSGLNSDSFLLETNKIAYASNLEDWAKIISGNTFNHQDKSKVKPLHYQSCIASYIFRKTQFGKLLNNNNIPFIWGIQPLSFSKKLNFDEQQSKNSFLDEFVGLETCYTAMPILYELLSYHKVSEKFYFLDLHKEFSENPSNSSEFVDICHLTKRGNLRVAKLYASLAAKIIY